MNSEDNFKGKLNDMLDSKEFPFEEESWKKLSLILDAERLGRRTGLGMFVGGALLVLAGFLVSFEGQTKNPVQTAEVRAPRVITPDAVPVAKENAPAVNPGTEAPEAQTALPVKATPSQPEVKEAVKPAAAQPIEKPVSEPVAALPVETPVPDHNPNLIRNANVTFPVRIRPSAPEVKATEQTPNTKTTDIGNNTTPPLNNSEPAKENGGNVLSMAPVTPAAVDNPSVLNAAPAQKEPETKTEQPAEPVNPTPTVAVAPAPDSTTSQPPAGPDKNSFPVKVLVLSIDGGCSMLAGWKQNDVREGNGFNPMFGVTYYSALNQKAYFSLGLQYTSAGNLSLNSHTSKTIRYNLGEESDVMVITPSTLHYLVVPVRYNHVIGGKNMLGGGINLAYLLNVESNVEEYHYRMNKKENIKQYTSSGYTDGFRWYDVQLSLFYRRDLWKNLSAGAEIFTGLYDVIYSQPLDNTGVQRLTGLKISLHYNLYNTNK
jgi:hypothetical protein